MIPRPNKINDHLLKVDYQSCVDLENYMAYLEKRVERLEGVLESIGTQVKQVVKIEK